jgi:hypothetical protein
MIVTTYPAEPQATVGLARCMEALHKMEIVWPSAGRALELLRGSKVNLKEAELAKFSSHRDRSKRSAEYPLDDSGHMHLADALFPHVIPSTTHSQDYESASHGSDEAHAMHHDSSSSINASSYPLHGWMADSAGLPAFDGAISTSVLPQMYSTGLGHGPNPRSQVMSMRGPSQHAMDQAVDTGQTSGMPQFWNDYATLSQLGPSMTYHGMIPTPSNPNLQLQAVQRTRQQSERYLPEHCDIYGESHSLGEYRQPFLFSSPGPQQSLH